MNNTSPYYSKSNGIIENVWKFVDRLIRAYGYEKWSQYVDWIMYLWNSEGKLDIEGYNPNHMVFGSLNVIPTFKMSNLVNIREYKDQLPWLEKGKLLASKWVKILDTTVEELLRRVQEAKDKYYIRQDKRYAKEGKNIKYEAGDLVKLRISFGLFEKQMDNWKCGYVVLEDLNERVKLKEIDTGEIITVNKNHTRPLVKDEWQLNRLLQEYRDKIINNKILFKRREERERENKEREQKDEGESKDQEDKIKVLFMKESKDVSLSNYDIIIEGSLPKLFLLNNQEQLH